MYTIEEILPELLGRYQGPAREFDGKLHLITDLKTFKQEVYDRFMDTCPELLGVDTETDGLVWKSRMIGASFSFLDETKNYYIPFRHTTGEYQPDILDFLPSIKEMFSVSWCNFVFHNAKFDMHMYHKEGVHFKYKESIEDTILMHYILNENEGRELKELAVTRLGAPARYDSIIDEVRGLVGRRLGIPKKKVGYNYVPIQILSDYACQDTYYTLKLYDIFKRELSLDEDLQTLYGREKLLMWDLIKMERNGVKLSTARLQEISTTLGETTAQLQKHIYESVGVEFNIGSSKQLVEVLQSKGVNTGRETKGKKMSTDVKALTFISHAFPIVNDILRYRAAEKLKSSYADSLGDHCDSRGYIRSSYRQAVAVTGRLQSGDPSLQVIPRPDKDYPETDVRDAFVVPDDDFIFVFIDLSQIELRMAAHYSQDPLFLSAYLNDIDIHRLTASEIFDVPFEEVIKEQRTAAKMINFGIMYGIGAKKLSDNLRMEGLNILEDEAQEYINRFLEKYEGIAAFINKYKRLARRLGYVKNYFGRIRRLDYLRDPYMDEWKRERGYRQAVNFVIQGSAADMFKIIIIRCGRILNGKKSKMIMNIHDELVFYIHKDEYDLIFKLKEAFEDWKFSIPIKASISVSTTSWAKKEELDI